MISSTGAVQNPSSLTMGGWGNTAKKMGSGAGLVDAPAGGGSPAAIPGWGNTQALGQQIAAGAKKGSNPSFNYSSFGTFRPPQYISDSTTQSVVNNQLAQGDQAADLRGLRKQYSQAGRSLGRGENYHASIESAAKQQGARADAANTEMSDATNNSKMRTDYEYAREMEGQKLAGLQQAFGQADWARNFGLSQQAAQQLAARQQAMLNILGPLYSMFAGG